MNYERNHGDKKCLHFSQKAPKRNKKFGYLGLDLV